LDAVHHLGSPVFVRPTPDAEEALLERTVRSADGPTLNFTTEELALWHAAIRREGRAAARAGEDDEGGLEPAPSPPLVVVCTPAARPIMADLARGMTPHVLVLSTAELEAVGVRVDTWWLAPP
jgi:hypothetical protein